MRSALRAGLLAGVGGWLLACPGPAPSEPVARIGDREVRLADLEEWIREDLYRSEVGNLGPGPLHEFRSRQLERMIDELLIADEAARRGMDHEALLQEVASRAEPPSEEEVRAFYDENRERIGDAPFEQVAPRIREFLRSGSAREARREFTVSLREQAGVEIRLEPPRVPVVTTGPSLGPEGATVTLIEFSDYQCPFCARSEPVVKEVLARYPERVRFVFRHFPLDRIHPRARPAAEAAACAQEGGRFWPFHDQLFGEAAGLEREDFVRYAREVGLDAEEFASCIDERRTKDAVEADVAAGRAAGVSGTPAFFVNGIPVAGTRTAEEFAGWIERELARGTPSSGG